MFLNVSMSVFIFVFFNIGPNFDFHWLYNSILIIIRESIYES